MLYIKKLVVDNKLSRKELAKVIGVASEDCLSNYLNGRHKWQVHYLIKLKDYFVCKGIVNDAFDVGDFLNEVEK